MPVNILEGLDVPPVLLPPPDSCGLDLWISLRAADWIRETLGASAITVRVEHDGRSARLVLWLRHLVPGIVLASGYPYAVILGDASLFWEQFDDVHKQLNKCGIARIELALSGHHINSCLTLEANRYVHREYLEKLRATRQVVSYEPFRSVEELERSYPSNLRWSVRKATQEGIKVSAVGVDSAETAQLLYEETMREKGAPAYYGVQRFHRLAQETGGSPIGQLYLAQLESMHVGVAAVIDSQATRHLVQLAVPRRFQKSRAADLLVATAMRDAYLSGKRYFDFMATSRDDTGLMQFKAKWGGVTEDIVFVTVPIKLLRSKVIDYLRYGSRLRTARSTKHTARNRVSDEQDS